MTNPAIGGDGAVYVPRSDGRVYAINDADGDGTVTLAETSSYDFRMAFQGSPAIAPGLLVVAPCDGLAAWHTSGDAATSERSTIADASVGGFIVAGALLAFVVHRRRRARALAAQLGAFDELG